MGGHRHSSTLRQSPSNAESVKIAAPNAETLILLGTEISAKLAHARQAP
jgi:hypothetical protein